MSNQAPVMRPYAAARALLAALVAWTLSADVRAQRRCDCDVEAARVERYDAGLIDAQARLDELVAIHVPFGLPIGPEDAHGERLLAAEGFVLNHDADLGTATWAAYRLTRDDVRADRPRTECFRADVRLPEAESVTCDDYEGSGFDRGHFVPSDDMARSEAAMLDTYTFTNLSPQFGPFNRGVWRRLEGMVRRWAEARGTVHVVTGAILDRDEDGVRDPDEGPSSRWITDGGRVVVPSAYFKIVVHRSEEGLDAIALVVPHVNKSMAGDAGLRFLRRSIRSIDEVEALTGVDFFPDLDEAIEAEFEADRADDLWESPRRARRR